MVRNTQIETLAHHFLVTGHLYDKCNQDFSLIELKTKKKQRDMYVPIDWVDLVVTSSRKFIITLM